MSSNPKIFQKHDLLLCAVFPRGYSNQKTRISHTHTTHTSCNVPKSQFYVNIRIMMDVLLLKRQEINCQFSCWYVHFDNLLQSTTGNHCLLSIFILPWLSPQKREKLILIDFYLCLFLSDNKQSLMRTAIQNCWLSQSHLKNVITL